LKPPRQQNEISDGWKGGCSSDLLNVMAAKITSELKSFDGIGEIRSHARIESESQSKDEESADEDEE
jgi:hypothetical protein